MKNTMNFYGLTTLSLGRGIEEEGDVIVEREDSHNYRRAILRDGKLDSMRTPAATMTSSQSILVPSSRVT